MKQKAVCLGFVFLLGLAPIAGAANGSLKVTSFPSGAEVWVDGAFTGKFTPMSVSLSEGDHDVTVQIPGSGWNPDHRTITITPGNNDLSVTLLPNLTEGPPGPQGDPGPPGPPGPPSDHHIDVRSTAVGRFALASGTSGPGNTAVGFWALRNESSEYGYNTAVGSVALYSNTTGFGNVAVGPEALKNNTSGQNNTAVGSAALRYNLGIYNTAVGETALDFNTSGDRNTAVGQYALRFSVAGNENIAIGSRAGSDLGYAVSSPTTSMSNNIFIGNEGLEGDQQDTIRIGQAQSRTFLAGIRGTATGMADAVTVMIDSSGQLGTVSSSERFKREIARMGKASSSLHALRPVVFKYRRQPVAGSQPLQFGLIAEEVADAMPELVVYDQQGRPEAVKYHLLAPLLLNEVQKQHRQLRAQWFLISGMVMTGLVLAVGRRRLG